MDHQLEDALTSLQAQAHHVQTRILQTACKGTMSKGVREELTTMLRDMADRLERAT